MYLVTVKRLKSNLSSISVNALKQLSIAYSSLKENNMQPRNLYPAKILIKSESRVKLFSDIQWLKVHLLLELKEMSEVPIHC